MTRLERSRPLRVHAARGHVTADRVVLALNAWLGQVPELKNELFVIASDMVATDPIPERLAEIGRTDGIAISDSRLLVNYYRTTLDGRLALGQGGGALAHGAKVTGVFHGEPPPGRAAHVARSLHELYPTLADVPVPRSWTGPIDRSWTGCRSSGACAGARTSRSGRATRATASGRATSAGGCSPRWRSTSTTSGRTPPGCCRRTAACRPSRSATSAAGSSAPAVARKERAEDAGKRPDPVTARVAALAPAGLVPVKQR